MSDIIGGVIGFGITLLILSYMFGDNPLFRLAAHLFVGVAAGYVGAVALKAVVVPHLLMPALTGSSLNERLLALVPLALAALLIFRFHPAVARWGSLPLAFLVGIGAAVALGGAVRGTLIPQVVGAAPDLTPSPGAASWVEAMVGALVALAGTVATLAYFHFGARTNAAGQAERPKWILPIAWLGEVFIAATFGAIYAGTLVASIAVLVGRVDTLWSFVRRVAGG